MARARTDATHPSNVLSQLERLTETDHLVLRLLAEHEVMSTEQLAVFCFRPGRPADAVYRLRYLAARALLVQFPHPGTHPPGTTPHDRPPGGQPTAALPRWRSNQRWAWSLGQGGAYWAGVEHVLNRDRWIDAWSRSFVPAQRPHVRRRLAFNDFFASLYYHSREHDTGGLDQWWGPARCADVGGGKVTPDAHGRWRHAGVTLPFWLYSDYHRDPFRTLITTVERHRQIHHASADSHLILVVMLSDSRERSLHRRWTEIAGSNGARLPLVATTTYGKLREWPTGSIWWPLADRLGLALRLHQLGWGDRDTDPRVRGTWPAPDTGVQP